MYEEVVVAVIFIQWNLRDYVVDTNNIISRQDRNIWVVGIIFKYTSLVVHQLHVMIADQVRFLKQNGNQ